MKNTNQKLIVLPDGTNVLQLGQGTWHMAENPSKKQQELNAIKTGIELGMTLIDTAEIYADGEAETLAGEAIHGVDRDRLFLVSKVSPHNAGRSHIFKSCENSLRRLKTDYLDLYLLHWRGTVPLQETVDCMQELLSQGKIRRFGVSNFDTADMHEMWNLSGGKACTSNEVLYHLGSRGIEYDLLPWMRKQKVPCIAYCPLAQAGRLRQGILAHPSVLSVARARGITSMQVLLAFVLQNKDIIAIPKAGTSAHVQENAKAVFIELTGEDLALLNKAFPAPNKKTPLDIQ